MQILPFRGYRYNPAKIDRLDDVISPPYDQFKEGLDDLLYGRHPYNIARIIMNKETLEDSSVNNRYTRGKAILDQWIQNGVFLQDPTPAIYPYFQDYRAAGEPPRTRKGFVALGEVTDYGERVVLPHERTLSKPKQDRLNLLRATLADTGLVFMLYSDPAGQIEQALDRITAGRPDLSALDLNREQNRLWKVEDRRAVEEIQQAMRDKQVIIADGHHRYEVALSFRTETEPKIGSDSSWNLYRYKLMSFVRLESNGITIFPIHRLVHSLTEFQATQFLHRLSEFFVTNEFPLAGQSKSAIVHQLVALLKQEQQAQHNAFGLYLPSRQTFALVRFKPETEQRISWPNDKSLAWRRLDVSILQVVVLGHLLGIGEKELAEQTNLEYVSDHEEAIRLTDAKAFQAAILLNPTPIEQVKEVVEAGDILPQKSTHFHPKLMEGLVFAKHV